MLAFAISVGFTRSDIEAIARLARLRLDEDEIELFARQLGEILEYAKQVQRIDTRGVLPTASVVTSSDVMRDRADETAHCLDRRAALANAPDPAAEAGLFKVPRVLG
jgi:aspartyl-tRNA(Asn)/glutamyl-tRNA(Gln) amidotransferase subunit C